MKVKNPHFYAFDDGISPFLRFFAHFKSFQCANFHVIHIFEKCGYKQQFPFPTKVLYYIGLQNAEPTRFSGKWLLIFIVGDFCLKNGKT